MAPLPVACFGQPGFEQPGFYRREAGAWWPIVGADRVACCFLAWAARDSWKVDIMSEPAEQERACYTASEYGFHAGIDGACGGQ